MVIWLLKNDSNLDLQHELWPHGTGQSQDSNTSAAAFCPFCWDTPALTAAPSAEPVLQQMHSAWCCTWAGHQFQVQLEMKCLFV